MSIGISKMWTTKLDKFKKNYKNSQQTEPAGDGPCKKRKSFLYIVKPLIHILKSSIHIGSQFMESLIHIIL